MQNSPPVTLHNVSNITHFNRAQKTSILRLIIAIQVNYFNTLLNTFNLVISI